MNEGLFCAYCDAKVFPEDRTCQCCGASTKSAIYQERKKDKPVDNNYTSYLNEFSMIAGTGYSLDFEIEDSNGFSISDVKVEWSLAPYGQTHSILLQKEIFTKDGDFVAELLEEETENMSGKYVQQVSMKDNNGNIIIPFRGIIEILPRIKQEKNKYSPLS